MWRPIVPWHPATAWALAATSLTFTLTTLAHGFDSGLRGALAVFVTWAIVRELAPKRALASALAPFAAIAWAIPGDTDVLSCVGVLAAARVASRTVGDPPTLLDRLALIGLAAWMSLRPAGLPVALVLAAIMFTDVPRARARVSGMLVLVAALLVGATEGTLQLRPGWDDPTQLEQLLVALTGAVAAWLLVAPLPRRLRARDDRRRGQLHGLRIRTARIAVVACVGAAIAWAGLDGAFELSCASAALLAAGLGGARLPSTRKSTSQGFGPDTE
jgi:hypothetical protein